VRRVCVILASLVASLASPPARAGRCPVRLASIPGHIAGRDYATTGWTRDLMPELRPATKEEKQFLESRGLPPRAIARLRTALAAKLPGMTVEAGIYRDHHSAAVRPELFLLIDFREQGKSIGYALFCYFLDARGKLIAELKHFYKELGGDRLRLAAATLPLVDNEIHRPLSLRELRLHADTLGRYVWATLRFRFRPGIWYRDTDGTIVRLPEIARRNFLRFCARYGLRWRELVRRQPEGDLPLRSLDELTTPLDYAQLVHPAELTVTIAPVLTQDAENRSLPSPPVPLPVGRAFLLGNARPEEGDGVFIRTSLRSPRSAYFMPSYSAVREVETGTP
jgi:hypothetical protein